MGDRDDYILFSGGAPGAEMAFGENAERLGIEEVNFAFEGHVHVRTRGLRILNHEELRAGDVSLDYVSRLMNRRYTDAPTIRKVLQSIWYQVNHGQEIYVIGAVLRGSHRQGRDRLGRGVRQAVQQAALRVRPGPRPLVRVEGRVVGALPRRRTGDPAHPLHRHRHAAPRRQRQGGDRVAVRSQLPGLVACCDGGDRSSMPSACRLRQPCSW